jgi:hypothetical protein
VPIARRAVGGCLAGLDVADEPGTAPIQFTERQVTRAAEGLHDLKAPGTLPEDNRLIKMLVRHGGAAAITG